MPMNLSYCRFQNTLAALRECQNYLADAPPVWDERLSDDEKKAAHKLMKLCGELASDFGEDAE